jgi:HEAT repeat protein
LPSTPLKEVSMHVSRWLFAAFITSCCCVYAGGLIGCKPAAPPVVAPSNGSGLNSTPKSETTQPDKSPPAIQPVTTKLPTVESPKSLNTSPPEKDSLRDLAARLVEPAEGAGWRISDSAALELERLGPDAPAKLLPLLADPLLEVRRGAAFHLLSSFDPAVPAQVTAFKQLLEDKDPTVRNIGFQAVKQLPPAEIATASPQLIALLDPAHETKPENRAAVARLAGNLGQRGAPFATSLEKAAAGDNDDRVRAAATFAYCQVASPPESAVPLLKQVLKDKKPAVRLVAAGRLRTLALKAEAATSDLGTALSDEDESVRIAASEALARIGPPAVSTLRTALESKNANAKKLALACFSALGPAAKEALPTIEKAQQDPDKDVSDAAKVLVERLK